MTTVADQAQRIRRRLYSGPSGRYDLLSGAINSSVTSLTLTDSANGVTLGTRLACGNELMLVRSVSSKTCTVMRGFFGTTAAAHADGDLIEVAPRFFYGDIVDTMQEEVRGWDNRVFRVEQRQIDSSFSSRSYDLVGAIDPLFLLSVTSATGSRWTEPIVTDNARTHSPAILLGGQDVATFPSGWCVQLEDFPTNLTTPLIVEWAEPFITDDWTDTTDLEDDVGLVPSMFDILLYGTMARVMSGKEVGRTDLRASGEDRRAEEVPPGYLAKTAGELFQMRDRRLAVEANKLRGRYPYRMG